MQPGIDLPKFAYILIVRRGRTGREAVTWAVTVGWDPNNDIDVLEMNLLQLIFLKVGFI